jgi:hypothetical protein
MNPSLHPHCDLLFPKFGLIHNSVILMAGKHLENFFCLLQEAGAKVPYSYSSMQGKLSMLQPLEGKGAMASLIPTW